MDAVRAEHEHSLKRFFQENPRAAIAYSGGVDSSFLLYFAKKVGAEVKAYYVKSPFQPEFEYRDALRMAEELSAEVEVIAVDILREEQVRKNPANRCYFCKLRIMDEIRTRAQKYGFPVLLDGTNASDDSDDRPGMKALEQLSVLSPLRLCGLTKDEIRQLSREAGLFTWDKPAYACLATRIPAGTEIEADALERVEKAESFLAALGFRDFRVRVLAGGEGAKLQLSQEDMDRLMGAGGAAGSGGAASPGAAGPGAASPGAASSGAAGSGGAGSGAAGSGGADLRAQILSQLKQHFKTVLLDLEVR